MDWGRGQTRYSCLSVTRFASWTATNFGIPKAKVSSTARAGGWLCSAYLVG